MEKQLKEIANLVRIGLQALNSTFPGSEVKENEDDFEGNGKPGHIEFQGIYVYPAQIDVTRNSILGKKTLSVSGFVVAQGITQYSYNRDIPDDYDVVTVSEHEHPHQAAMAAVMLYASNCVGGAFEGHQMAAEHSEEEVAAAIKSLIS